LEAEIQAARLDAGRPECRVEHLRRILLKGRRRVRVQRKSDARRRVPERLGGDARWWHWASAISK
jgi:hypothetical protein